jgi:hypothetical protein
MLLFDENISARAAEILRTEFPGAKHVKDLFCWNRQIRMFGPLRNPKV